jgi:hypothetical protein
MDILYEPIYVVHEQILASYSCKYRMKMSEYLDQHCCVFLNEFEEIVPV